MAEYTEFDYEEELEEIEETSDTNEDIDETGDEPSFSDLLEDPDLFERFKKGDYSYETNEYGKHAYGTLIDEVGERDLYAQKTLPGKPRGFDSSHLIANRYHGAGGYENLDAGTVSLNRGAFKCVENEWGRNLDEGDRVFVDVQTYHNNGSSVPSAWMGYSIQEHEDGTRDWDAFSFCSNASTAEQAEWERIIEEEDF